jgi:hypothetical protein
MSKIAKATIQTVCFSILALVIGAMWGLSRASDSTAAVSGSVAAAITEPVFAPVPSDKVVYVVASGDLRPAGTAPLK